ncbi:MAG: hypothetical protein WDN03_00280 [Rhizomicrobium sp.]
MPLYRIAVTIYGTAYFRAADPGGAIQKAASLENTLLEVRDVGSEVPISGANLTDPALPEISLSPAMTVIGPDKDDKPELVEDGHAPQ